MYFFTGSNIFGQWYGCEGNTIDRFVTFPENLKIDCNFNVKKATLVHIGWSHNIFQFNNDFYITGDYKSSGQCLELVKLPNECSMNSSNFTIISDDYHLILVNKNTCTYWSVNMENGEVKMIKLTTEIPSEYISKKLKKDEYILTCKCAHGTLVFLTSNRLVYNGLLPNLIDTNHCGGNPVDIQSGYEHYMLLTDTGMVYSWGNGRRLQLGHGDVSILDNPTEVEALAGIKIVKISAGGWHSMALSEFGDLYAWGWNEMGQLGVKENSNREPLKSYSLPTLVDIFDDNGSEVKVNIKDVACGSRHSAILLEDNTIWTTGNNKYGQLGLTIQNHPIVHYFKKSWSSRFDCRLKCGQWSTVIVVK